MERVGTEWGGVEVWRVLQSSIGNLYLYLALPRLLGRLTTPLEYFVHQNVQY